MWKIDDVLALHDRFVAQWHRQEVGHAEVGPMLPVADEHAWNFRLWHIEDEARRRDVDDKYIADQKRAIDKCNQARNDAIERIDEALIEAWPWVVENPSLPMNTESPGAAIDRLSIAALKIYHMKEQVDRVDVDDAHRAKCREKLATLERQRSDIGAALETLLDDLKNRRKRVQVYRQFKMYNDPNLNPALYGAKKGA